MPEARRLLAQRHPISFSRPAARQRTVAGVAQCAARRVAPETACAHAAARNGRVARIARIALARHSDHSRTARRRGARVTGCPRRAAVHHRHCRRT